jgi:hypothetical protein
MTIERRACRSQAAPLVAQMTFFGFMGDAFTTTTLERTMTPITLRCLCNLRRDDRGFGKILVQILVSRCRFSRMKIAAPYLQNCDGAASTTLTKEKPAPLGKTCLVLSRLLA